MANQKILALLEKKYGATIPIKLWRGMARTFANRMSTDDA
jgi:hypothetical protein